MSDDNRWDERDHEIEQAGFERGVQAERERIIAEIGTRLVGLKDEYKQSRTDPTGGAIQEIITELDDLRSWLEATDG